MTHRNADEIVNNAIAYCNNDEDDEQGDLHCVAIGVLWQHALEALAPPPHMLLSEWAEAHRILPEDEAEPGPWRNSRTPYVVEIMDRLCPYDPTEEVVLMKGSQIGGTEIAINFLGYCIEHTPGRILVVQPGEDEANDFSRQRVQPMIESTPAVAARVGEARTGRGSADSVTLKEFPGGSIKFSGSHAPAGLRSKPVRFLIGDEVDGWAQDCGGEGDPLELAERRQATYANRKRFYVSTPLVQQTSRIEPRFKIGDQRYYFVPCPRCEHMHVLKWASFVIPQDEDGDKDPDCAYMKCPKCEGKIDNWQKDEMLLRGEWRATAKGNGRTRSYHLSSLYSPVGWLSWASIAETFLRCYEDPVKLKSFVNTILGESWSQEDGETVDAEELRERLRESWEGVPFEVLCITAGVDIQGDRAEVEIVGWGHGWESWSLDYVVIPGDPSGMELWDDLDRLLRRKYERADGVMLPIRACGVDAGYETTNVYRFAATRWKRRVWPIKGKEGQRDIWPIKWSKPKKRGMPNVRFKIVGVDAAKRDVYTRLVKCTTPGAGYMHVPAGRDASWFEQLTAERMVRKVRRGRRFVEWHLPQGVRNEALDCRVYAYAVMHGLHVAGHDFAAAQDWCETRKRALDASRKNRQHSRRRSSNPADHFIPDRNW